MAKKKKQLDPKCPVEGCSKRLNDEWKAECPKCGKFAVCKAHVYDHACDRKKKSEKASSGETKSSLTVVKKANGATNEKLDPKVEAELVEKLKGITIESQNSSQIIQQLISYTQKLDSEKAIIIEGLESDSKKVNSASKSLIESSIKQISEAGQLRELAKLKESIHSLFDSSMKDKKISSREENLFSNLASIFGVVAATLDQDSLSNSYDAILGCIVNAKNDKVQKGASEGLKHFCTGCGNASLVSEMGETIQKYTTALTGPKGVEKENRRNGMAMATAVLLKHFNSQGTVLTDTIRTLISSIRLPAKNSAEEPVLGSLRLLNLLCKELGAYVFPFCFETDKKGKSCIQLLLCKLYGKGSKGVRSEVKKATVQLFKTLGPCEIDCVAPLLVEAMKGNSWRDRVLSLTVLGQLGKRKASGLSRHLPVLVPTVMECTSDTKKEVAESSSNALKDVSSIIDNPETVKLMSWLLDALTEPSKVEACLDEIMDCTFVNSIDNESLALMIPVVYRAMREGNAELKQKAAITTGNICTLVADVANIRPFVPLLLPELQKLNDHSSPKVRKYSETARKALLEGTRDDETVKSKDSSHKLREKRVGDAMAKMEAALDTLEGRLDMAVREYLAKNMVSFLFNISMEELNPELPSRMVSEYLGRTVYEAVEPCMSIMGENKGGKLTSDEMESLKMSLEEIIFEIWLLSHNRVSRRSRHDSTEVGDEKDYLLFMPSIILAFASKMLLRRTKLCMERGHRYAFVGMNGVGKTTLLNRIAARDIYGFPKEVTCYYVQHEILSEDKDLSVIGYMHRLIGEARSITEEKIQVCLRDVGFDDSMQETPVANLSGGWRMRLAIARSMLYEANLLLLDEPTNHLDHAAIEWLQDHLTNKLPGTTIGVVSHDYDFLSIVATDIVHICDLNLTYYDCGFKDFAAQRPEIVAALPRAEKKQEGENGSSDTKTDGELSALEALALDQSDPKYQAVIKTMKPIIFPEGQKLDGITSRGKSVMTLDKVMFRYPGTERVILNGVSQRLNLNSRVALLSKNGAGKSTLLKVLIGMVELGEGCSGKVWRHHNLRTAYIAQHSMHHLEANLEQSPCQYIQARFWEGRDKETAKMITLKLTPDEEELMTQRGEVCDVLSRVKRGKKLYYEIVKTGRKMKEGQTEFKSIDELEMLGKPHAVKLCRMFDEKLKAASSGMDTRELTTPSMIAHLKEFGIPEDLAQRKIRWMSGGQKCRLVLAAAMWTRPHLIALDEPTNYLDNETLAALTAALRSFRGGVITVSHHAGFVNALAKELWHVADGKVTVENLKKKK